MTKQNARCVRPQPKPKPPTRFLVVRQRLGDDHLDRLKQAGRRLGRDMSELVRQAIDEHLEKWEA